MEEILHCELPLIVTRPISRRGTITLLMILEETSEVCEVTIEQMKSAIRKREVAVARHIYSYLCRKHTRCSFDYIGRQINRDHSSVLFGAKKIKNWLDMKYYRQEFESIITSIEDKLT